MLRRKLTRPSVTRASGLDQSRQEEVQLPKCGIIASGLEQETFLQVSLCSLVQHVWLVLKTLDR